MSEFYEFELEISNNGLRYDYGFNSKTGKSYYVYLEAAPAHLEELEQYDFLSAHGYAVGFYPFDEDEKPQGPDYKLGATVCTILKDFISRFERVVLLYHCDASDGKQGKRKASFERWDSIYAKEIDAFRGHIKLEVTKHDGPSSYEYLGYFAICSQSELKIVDSEFAHFAELKVSSRKPHSSPI